LVGGIVDQATGCKFGNDITMCCPRCRWRHEYRV